MILALVLLKPLGRLLRVGQTVVLPIRVYFRLALEWADKSGFLPMMWVGAPTKRQHTIHRRNP